jgi:glycerol-3-phosphate dehydrogenase (NAD(P)+)
MAIDRSLKVAVLVAGSWGTALASVLADNGYQVMLWSRRADQVHEINEHRTNQRYLQNSDGLTLSRNITATTEMGEAIEGANCVVFAAPTVAMREVVITASAYIKKNMLIVHVAKGFEKHSLKRMSQVIGEQLPQVEANRVVVLSGPSHAEEVIVRKPTTVVVAAEQAIAAEQALQLFCNEHFRVYLNQDIIGVEIAGALKNIIALAAGMSDGLQLGDNAKAALVTRGLNEIVLLGEKLGAKRDTFYGLAGLGDLLVTCGSLHSRNYRAGMQIGKGQTIDQVQLGMGMVVEGILSTKTASLLAQQHQVAMPIVQQLYDVIFAGKSPKQAVHDLMTRDPRSE